MKKAAENFRAAITKEPNEPAHYLALGCACTNRVVSLGYASIYTQMLAEEQGSFAATLENWEKNRADFEKNKAEKPEEYRNVSFGEPKPIQTPFRVFVTKDDKRPFSLTPAQTIARLRELSLAAQEAWDKGVALTTTPDEKAQAYYLQSWGLSILRQMVGIFHTDGVFVFFEPPQLDESAVRTPDVPSPSKILGVIDKAIALAPQKPLFWQAKGDLLNEDREIDVNANALAAYEKAVLLAPKNRNLWYLLYQDALESSGRENREPTPAGETKDAVLKPVKPQTPPSPFAKTLSYLHKAQTCDRSNAWLLYEEAGVLFRAASLRRPEKSDTATANIATGDTIKDTDKEARKLERRGVDLIVQGNRSQRLVLPIYQDCCPVWLAGGMLNIIPSIELDKITGWNGWNRVLGLAQSVTDYVQKMGEQENTDEAVRASRALLDMGFRLIGDWPLEDDGRTKKVTISVDRGTDLCEKGYEGLASVYGAIGDTDQAADITDAKKRFQARVGLYKQAVAARKTPFSEFDRY